jgi:hypothetical protein
MGLEVIALFLIVLFSVGGLVIPVVTWLLWSQARRQRFLEGLRLCGLNEIEELGDEHAEAPIRVRVTAAGRPVDISAEIRGGTPVWRLRMPVRDGPPSFALRRRGARELREVRGLPEVERLVGLPSSLVLRAEDREALAASLGERLPTAMAGLISGHEQLLQVALTGGALHVELARGEDTAKAVLRCLKRTLAFAERVGLVEAAPLVPPARAPAHLLAAGGGSGAPVVTPG